MLNLVDTVVLGVVQGLTEFLPVSSTGHLILAEKLLQVGESNFLTSFTIAIQVGSILAVLWLYGRDLFNKELVKKIAAAFVPTAVIGFLIYKIVKTIFLESGTIVAAALVLGGVAMIIIERWYAKREQFVYKDLATLSYRDAALIGLAQALAMIPGVSRSAATIFGGLALGLSRSAIVEFSFLLAIPTMLAATGYDLFKSGASFSGDQFGLIAVGAIVSFIVSVASIKWLIGFIRQHNFVGFGVYRVVVGIIWLLAFWLV